MTPNRWKSWPAQEPSADFSDRTVAAIFRDERRRRATARSSRWAMLGAVAVALVGGGAWGFAKLSPFEAPRSDIPIVSFIDPPPPVPALAEPSTVVAPLTERAMPVPAVAPPSAPHRVRAASRPAASAPPPVPDAGRPLALPRCHYSQNDAICDSY